MFLYQNIIKFGQESLCKEESLTTVCSKDGDWKSITDDNDTCVYRAYRTIRYCYNISRNIIDVEFVLGARGHVL